MPILSINTAVRSNSQAKLMTPSDADLDSLSPARIIAEWEDAIRVYCTYDLKASIERHRNLLHRLKYASAAATKSTSATPQVIPDPRLLARLWFNIGAIHAGLNQQIAATQAFDTCLHIYGNSIVVLYGVGIAHYSLKRYRKATKAFEKCSECFDEQQVTEASIDCFEMGKDNKSKEPIVGKQSGLIRKKWKLVKSDAQQNADLAKKQIENQKKGVSTAYQNLITVQEIPVGVLYGPDEDMIHHGEVGKKMALAKKLRFDLYQAINAEKKVFSRNKGLQRTQSDQSKARAKPLPGIPELPTIEGSPTDTQAPAIPPRAAFDQPPPGTPTNSPMSPDPHDFHNFRQTHYYPSQQPSDALDFHTIVHDIEKSSNPPPKRRYSTAIFSHSDFFNIPEDGTMPKPRLASQSPTKEALTAVSSPSAASHTSQVTAANSPATTITPASSAPTFFSQSSPKLFSPSPRIKSARTMSSSSATRTFAPSPLNKPVLRTDSPPPAPLSPSVVDTIKYGKWQPRQYFDADLYFIPDLKEIERDGAIRYQREKSSPTKEGGEGKIFVTLPCSRRQSENDFAVDDSEDEYLSMPSQSAKLTREKEQRSIEVRKKENIVHGERGSPITQNLALGLSNVQTSPTKLNTPTSPNKDKVLPSLPKSNGQQQHQSAPVSVSPSRTSGRFISPHKLFGELSPNRRRSLHDDRSPHPLQRPQFLQQRSSTRESRVPPPLTPIIFGSPQKEFRDFSIEPLKLKSRNEKNEKSEKRRSGGGGVDGERGFDFGFSGARSSGAGARKMVGGEKEEGENERMVKGRRRRSLTMRRCKTDGNVEGKMTGGGNNELLLLRPTVFEGFGI
ncbi:hypothetical protein MMC25_006917 [Agyrium rufum]|nr:hypothetical protein [Agyrium rufum]